MKSIKNYSSIINKIDRDGNDSTFNQNEIKNIEYLLNHFEILSTQVEYAKIDVNIVNSITGNV